MPQPDAIRDQFKQAVTYFCPRGCNVFTTTDSNPECGACGSVMTTDREPFDDVIEAIECDGIRQAEKALARPEPG